MSADAVIINGTPLTPWQLAEFGQMYGAQPLPGRYWYDPTSGLYGDVGAPPAGMMAPGHAFGALRADASHGITGVHLNGRQITAAEAQAIATTTGVVPQPGHYWLDAAGNVGFEGHLLPLGNLTAALTLLIAAVRAAQAAATPEAHPVDDGVPPLLLDAVFDGDLRGDPKAARAAIEARANGASGERDPESAALARGMVDVLSGHPARAVALFEACAARTTDPRVLLRAESWRYLARHLCFGRFPGGGAGAGGGLDIGLRWNGAVDLQRAEAHGRRLGAALTAPAMHVEYASIHGRVRLLIGRGIARNHHVMPDRTTEQIDGALRGLRGLVDDPRLPPRVRAAALRAGAGVCRAGDALERGRRLLDEARAMYRQSADAHGLARCELTALDWRAAPVSAPDLWNFVTHEDPTGSDRSWAVASQEFDRWGPPPADLEALQRGYAALPALPDAPRFGATVALRLGYLAALGGDFDRAAAAIAQAGDAFAAVGDARGLQVATVHGVLCDIARGRPVADGVCAAVGAWGAGSGSFSDALALGRVLRRAARYWLSGHGDYARALAACRGAEAVFAALDARASLAQTLRERGVMSRAIGDRAGAVRAFEDAMAVYADAAERWPSHGQRLRARGRRIEPEVYDVHQSVRDIDGMQRMLERMQDQEAQAEPSPDIDGMLQGVMALFDQGMPSADDLAQIEQMQATIEAGLTRSVMARKAAFSRVEIRVMRAVSAEARGDHAEVERCTQAALDATARAGPEADRLRALIYSNRRRYAEAQAAWRRYVTHAPEDQLLDLCRRTLGQSGAEGRTQAETTRRDRQVLEATMFAAVRAFDEAEARFATLEREWGADWWRASEPPWWWLLGRAETREGLGRLHDALRDFEQAVALIEARRVNLAHDGARVGFAGRPMVEQIFAGAARVALRLGEAARDPAEARAWVARAHRHAERGRARALVTLMTASAGLAQRPRDEQETVRTWRELSARLVVWRAQRQAASGAEAEAAGIRHHCDACIAEDEARLAAFEERLATIDPGLYRAVANDAPTLDLDAIRAALAPGRLLLQYTFEGPDVLGWAIAEDGRCETLRQTDPAGELARAIRRVHAGCEHRRPIDEAAARVAERLLEPFSELIDAHLQLMIVPSGDALRLTFAVLPWRGRPLGETRDLSYLPSASALQFFSAPRSRQRLARALVVGDPDGMAWRPPHGGAVQHFDPLPGARREAEHVARLYPEHTLLVGEQATEDAVRREIGEAAIVHLATHGRLDPQAPLQSGLLLADGRCLTVYELMGMGLSADLAVLSACETGRGERGGGDEILGLGRGLLAAGARSIVVSLWPVADASTALLMGRFHQRLRDGAPAARALRQASNWLRRRSPAELAEARAGLAGCDAQGARLARPQARRATTADCSHPHHWAPFVLIGAPDLTLDGAP